MKHQKKILFFSSLVFIILIFNFIKPSNEWSREFLSSFLNADQKIFIKKYVFPYEAISQQEKLIANLNQQQLIMKSKLIDYELSIKNNLIDLTTNEPHIINLDNNLVLKKSSFQTGFNLGVKNFFPGSGYLDFHNDNLVILSAQGILGYSINDRNELSFKQIKNNIEEYINKDQFIKSNEFSIKDLHIYNDKIFISFTEEIEKNCWNIGVIFSEMNYNDINFKKIFSSNECIHSRNNPDKDFNATGSGGRIVGFDNNQIFLSIGEFKSRYLAQDKVSTNGKIIKIDINSSKYKIISMGHRNPQGLYFDKENNFILETEHGPFGGDEINLIELDKLNTNDIPNFGWAMVSEGEHYGGRSDDNKLKYKKYPLFKSHSDYGFVEPLKSFVPSIGISEITKISDNFYVVSSLRDKSIYFFNLDKDNKIINFSRVEVFERVRDIAYKNNKLYLFLEDTASIGIIDL